MIIDLRAPAGKYFECQEGRADEKMNTLLYQYLLLVFFPLEQSDNRRYKDKNKEEAD